MDDEMFKLTLHMFVLGTTKKENAYSIEILKEFAASHKMRQWYAFLGH